MLIRSLTAAAAVFLAIPGLGSFANVGDVYDGIEKASGYKLTGENRKQAARLSWEIAQEQVRLKRDEFLGMNRNDQSGFSVSYRQPRASILIVLLSGPVHKHLALKFPARFPVVSSRPLGRGAFSFTG